MTKGLRAALVAAVLVLGLGGCGSLADDDVPPTGPDDPVSSDDQGSASRTPSPSPTTTPDVPGADGLPADLTVTLDESGEGQTRTWSLTCAPVGGDHPDAVAACAALTAAGADGFDPVPRDVACTEIYGGPQTATVVGTVDGSSVRAAFSRTNGCEIARWDALGPLLGSVDGLM